MIDPATEKLDGTLESRWSHRVEVGDSETETEESCYFVVLPELGETELKEIDYYSNPVEVDEREMEEPSQETEDSGSSDRADLSASVNECFVLAGLGDSEVEEPSP